MITRQIMLYWYYAYKNKDNNVHEQWHAQAFAYKVFTQRSPKYFDNLFKPKLKEV